MSCRISINKAEWALKFSFYVVLMVYKFHAECILHVVVDDF